MAGEVKHGESEEEFRPHGPLRFLRDSWLHVTLPFLAALAVSGLLVFFIVIRQSRRQAKDYEAANEVALVVAGSVRRLVSTASGAVIVLASIARLAARQLVHYQGGKAVCDHTAFASVASQLMSGIDGVSSMELAPGGRITCVHPLEGNEGAIGFNLFNASRGGGGAAVLNNSDAVTLRGPLEVAQGGFTAVLAHFPVLLREHDDRSAGRGELFWGIATCLMFISDLASAAKAAAHHIDDYYSYRMVSKATQTMLFQSAVPPENPDRTEIDLGLNGIVWIFEIAPLGGWPLHEDKLAGEVAFLVVVAALQIWAVYLAYRTAAERHAMAVSVSAVTRVSEQFVRYDTAGARRVLHSAGGELRRDLLAPLATLLNHLEEYKPYLPDALQHMHEEEPEPSPRFQRAPTAPELCLCFTDIQSSTQLWEACQQGMYEALQIHNDLLRRELQAANGYEVKTIGDAFMTVFEDAAAGLRFSLTVQEKLVEQDWSSELTWHALCRRRTDRATGGAVWHGLRVRIGLQYGRVRPEQNPVTRRHDYFGPAVNVAARVEAAVKLGGLIGATAELLAAVGPEALSGPAAPEIFPVGPVELKGVRDPVDLSILVPARLRKRLRTASRAAHLLCPGRFPHSPSECSSELSRGSTATRPSAHSTERRQSPTSLLSLEHDGLSDSGHSRTTESTHGPRPSHPMLDESESRLSHFSGPSVTTRSARGAQWTRMDVASVAVARHHGLKRTDGLLAFLALCAQTADASNGVLHAVLSERCTLGWNAAMRCEHHAAQCEHFLQVVLRADQSTVHVGAATGGVGSGTIPAGRNRHATIVGGCVELSTALCDEACICGDVALATGAVAGYARSMGRAHRAQSWDLGDSEEPLTVWAVTCPDDDGGFAQLASGDDSADGGWVADFHKACRGDAAAREALQAAAGDILGASTGTVALRPNDGLAEAAHRASAGVLGTRRLPVLIGVLPSGMGCPIVLGGAVSGTMGTIS